MAGFPVPTKTLDKSIHKVMHIQGLHKNFKLFVGRFQNQWNKGKGEDILSDCRAIFCAAGADFAKNGVKMGIESSVKLAVKLVNTVVYC